MRENDSAPISYEIVLGVTQLLVVGHLLLLLKCPFCNFRNIHEDEITHHIRYKEDAKHNVDVDKIDKKQYIVTKKEKESRYRYEKRENLPLPSIKCLWCNYRDKIERDLEWHFLQKHKYELYKISPDWERRTDKEWTSDPFSWMYADIDYRLYKAVQLAKGTSQARVGSKS